MKSNTNRLAFEARGNISSRRATQLIAMCFEYPALKSDTRVGNRSCFISAKLSRSAQCCRNDRPPKGHPAKHVVGRLEAP